MIKKVTELLSQRKISQKELAQHLNVTPSTITAWKNDMLRPSISDLINIAEFLDVSTDYLLGLTDDPTMKQLPSGEGSCSTLAKILDDYMVEHNLQPSDKELKVALDIFAAIIKNLQENKE